MERQCVRYGNVVFFMVIFENVVFFMVKIACVRYGCVRYDGLPSIASKTQVNSATRSREEFSQPKIFDFLGLFWVHFIV